MYVCMYDNVLVQVRILYLQFMRHGASEFKDESEFSPRVKDLASLSVSFPNFIRIIFVTDRCDSAQHYI